MGALIPVMLLFMLAGLVIGQATYSPPSTLQGFEVCALPCWNHIIVGRTNFAEAKQRMLEIGYTTNTQDDVFDMVLYDFESALPGNCSVSLGFEGALVSDIIWRNCPPTTFGDLMRVLGYPDGIMVNTGSFHLVFSQGALHVLAIQRACNDDPYTPHSLVASIGLGEGDFLPGYADWQGLNHLRTYPPFENDAFDCY